MNKKMWKGLLGYDPNRAQKETILTMVQEEKISIQEAAAKFNLGKTVILGDDGKFEYEGKRITSAEWRKINPLGAFGKIVIIGTRENMDKSHEIANNEKNS